MPGRIVRQHGLDLVLRRGVPILNAFTGSHSEDYHTRATAPDKLNYEGAERIAKFMELVARGLATSSEVPDYIEAKRERNGRPRRAARLPRHHPRLLPGRRRERQALRRRQSCPRRLMRHQRQATSSSSS
ncbi:MAG: hypothetical protein R3F11_31315 [Verrucomicrobiales bacterium]